MKMTNMNIFGVKVEVSAINCLAIDVLNVL